MSRGEDRETKQRKLNQMKIQMQNDLKRYYEIQTKFNNKDMTIDNLESYSLQTFNALKNRFLAVSNYYGFDEKGKYLFNATNILKEHTNLKRLEICKLMEQEVNSLTLETKERINSTDFLKKLNLKKKDDLEIEK